MKKNILSSLLAILLFVNFLPIALAQTDIGPDTGMTSNSRSNNTTPDTGNTGSVLNNGGTSTSKSNNTFEPGVGGGPSDMTRSSGADNALYWLWLLPLLAIPLLYFVWRSTDETSQSRGYRE